MSHIYALLTDSGKIKLGRTNQLETRIKQHQREWPALDLLFAFRVMDCVKVESEIFNWLSIHGLKRCDNREIFEPTKTLFTALKMAFFSVSQKEWESSVYKKRAKIIDYSWRKLIHEADLIE